MKYSEKLKDPRWQKKRLKVMQGADFKCQICDNSKKTLHIHHLEYCGEPWEATNDQLMCICSLCHGFIHDGLTLEEVTFLMNKENYKLLLYFVVDLSKSRFKDNEIDILKILMKSMKESRRTSNGKK